MDAPKVTIFLPTVARYRQGHLARAVNSALSQTWTNLELLVVDDGSTDGTSEYLEKCQHDDRRVKAVRLDRNTGLPALALAKAFPYATGDYFAWLFDDCELEPDHIETLVSAALSNPSWGMVYACARAQLTANRSFLIGAPVDQERMRNGTNVIPNVCVLTPRSTIDNVGWYDPHVLLKRLCDWDLWRRIGRQYEIGFIDRVLATEHGVGLAGSLGRIYHADMDLVLRYSESDRNARLSPEHLSLDDGFRRDLGIEMTNADKISLELILLEHSTLVMDIPHAMESSRLLHELGGIDGPLDKAEGHPTMHAAHSDSEIFAAAVAKLLRKRFELHAEREIRSEETARAALEAADQRIVAIRELEQRLRLVDERTLRAEADHQETLARFRDAADQRLQLLGEANEHAGILEKLAEERLHLLQTANQQIELWNALAEERLQLISEANDRAESWNRIAEERLRLLEGTSEQAQSWNRVADERLQLLTGAYERAEYWSNLADERLQLLAGINEQRDFWNSLAEDRLRLLAEANESSAFWNQLAEERLKLIENLQERLALAELAIAPPPDEAGLTQAGRAEIGPDPTRPVET